MPQLYKKGDAYIAPSEMARAVLDGQITETERDNDYTLGTFDYPDPIPTPANTMGFVNLHTNNSENGNGDGLWYPLDHPTKVKHMGEPEMTMLDAILQGIEIGETS